MKILFCDQIIGSSSASSWASLSLNLAGTLIKRGHEVYAPIQKHQFLFNTWEKKISFIRNLEELEGEIDIVQGHASLRSSYRTTEIANKTKSRPFQWVINELFLSWNDFYYMVRHELPILIRRRKRSLGHLAGLAPRSLRIPKNNLPKLIVPAEYLKNELTNLGINSNNVFIIPLPVDTNLFSPVDEETRNNLKEKLNITGKVVLFFGGYTALRGIDTTIKMFDIVKKKIKDTQLIFALWNAPNPFRGYVNLGLRRRDLYDAINLADVVCIPFRGTHQMRCTPSTLLEAMSCARAVVSTNVAGVPEIIKSYREGILIDYTSDSQVVKESARAVIELLENDAMRQELGENARKRILTEHAIDHVATCFESVYESALDE